MIDPALVTKKLGLLRENILRLQQRRRPTLAEFAASRDLQDATGMSFIAGMQEAIEIAMQIVSHRALGVPGAYAEARPETGRRPVNVTSCRSEPANYECSTTYKARSRHFPPRTCSATRA
jgi:hypothetical protein